MIRARRHPAARSAALIGGAALLFTLVRAAHLLGPSLPAGNTLLPALATSAVLLGVLACTRAVPVLAPGTGRAHPSAPAGRGFGHEPDGGTPRQRDPDAPGRPRPRAPGASAVR